MSKQDEGLMNDYEKFIKAYMKQLDPDKIIVFNVRGREVGADEMYDLLYPINSDPENLVAVQKFIVDLRQRLLDAIRGVNRNFERYVVKSREEVDRRNEIV